MRKRIAVALVALLAWVAPINAQQAVYTNLVNGTRVDRIIRVERRTLPAAPIPPSIVTTEVLPRNYKTPLGPTSYVPQTTRVATPSIPAPKPQPWYVNGLLVGESPNGLWTSTTIGRQIVDVNVVSTPRRPR